VDATLDNRGGVTVSWDLVDGRVRLRVDDDGPGLSNTTNLFVPFFTTKPGGSGIGLVCAGRLPKRTAVRSRSTIALPVQAAALNSHCRWDR
jgi:signal transduction histidine kinase